MQPEDIDDDVEAVLTTLDKAMSTLGDLLDEAKTKKDWAAVGSIADIVRSWSSIQPAEFDTAIRAVRARLG